MTPYVKVEDWDGEEVSKKSMGEIIGALREDGLPPFVIADTVKFLEYARLGYVEVGFWKWLKLKMLRRNLTYEEHFEGGSSE